MVSFVLQFYPTFISSLLFRFPRSLQGVLADKFVFSDEVSVTLTLAKDLVDLVDPEPCQLIILNAGFKQFSAPATYSPT